MSDNDNNTSSNGFATGWTHLIPEELPVESVCPGDDGIESLTETPSPDEKVTWSATAPVTGDWTAPPEGAMSREGLYDHPISSEVPVESVGQDDAGRASPAEIPCVSEEMTGSVAVEERGDGVGLPEAIISEKGQQVCPESSSDGSAPSSPAILGPYSHEPLISSEEGAVPFISPTVTCEATNPCSDPEGLVSASSPPDIYSSISSAPEIVAPVSPAPDACTDTSSAPQSLAEIHTDVMAEPGSAAADACTDINPALEATALESQSQASMLETQEVDELGKEEVACEPAELLASVTPQEEVCGDSYPEAPPFEATEGVGLRRRHAPPSFSPEPIGRSREEEEDEEEEELYLREKKKEEEGSWLSLNKCIVGALVLLCLGSILFTEDDSAQSRDTEHGKQDWPTPDAQLPDPKEVSQLLSKLAEENQQMAILQAQLQTQKEELDLVLKAAEPTEKEPPAGLTENYSTVYSRVWEGESEPAPAPGKSSAAEEELGAMEQGQERRTERVDVSAGREGDRKRQWAERVREVRREEFQEKDWKKGRENGKEWWQGRGEKKEKREGDWKHRKDGGKSERREWKEKVEKRRAWEKEREWQKGGEKKGWKSDRKDQRPDRWHGQKKDWKAQKESWKAQSDWRDERGTGQQKGRKGKHWQGSSERKPRALDLVDYWKHQEEKFWKHRRPVNCHGSAECARKEGLVPVKQAEFEGLLGSYLGKLRDKAGEGKDAVALLVGKFFADGVFVHDRVPFQEFAEDVEDVLEDLVEGDRQLEDEMEDFEKVALRRFALAVGEGEREGRGMG